jgi:ketosteroid isomerase-like protein
LQAYLQRVFGERDAARRQAAIRELYADDVMVYDQDAQATGHTGIDHVVEDIRRLEDLDSAALTHAEVKAIASGNPLVIEKAEVDAELIRLTQLRSAAAR